MVEKGDRMIELDDEGMLYAFDKEATPVISVVSGETVRIRTKDCFGNQVKRPEDQLGEIDWNEINPATGPIYVEGAKAGGVLKVKIERIELDGQTVSCTGEGEGVCGDRFEGWSTHISRIEGDELVWDESLRIPLKPMIGVIGVAPVGEPVNCGTPGSHGGNMDTTQIAEGATLYFPVAVDGALFGCGDMHAVMGDGEVSVSGAEVAGFATVTLTAVPDMELANPLLLTKDEIGVIASAPTLDEAADVAVHDLVRILAESTGRSEEELTMLLSLVADVRVSQMVDPEKTVRFMMPRTVADDLGFRLP